MTFHVSRFAGAAALAAVFGLAACNKPSPATPAAGSATPAPGAPAAATSAADAASAKAFLEGVYAHYKTNATGNTWSPLNPDAQVFDADTTRLLADDAKALNGEEGAIEADPICTCQDYEGFTAAIAVQSATATTAKATADFKVFKTEQSHHLEFDLVKENGAWRIHDLRENDQTEQPPGPGLRATLEQEIKQLAAEAKSGQPKPAGMGKAP